MIRRRTFVCQSTATLGFLALAGCGESVPAGGPPVNMADILKRPIVDAHAHVFNAKDLPGFQFIAQVYVEPILGALSWPLLLVLMGVAHHVGEAAPDDEEERDAFAKQAKSAPTADQLLTKSLLTLEEGSLPVRSTNPLPMTPPPAPAAPGAPAAAPAAPLAMFEQTPSPEAQRQAYAILARRAGVAPAAPAAAFPTPGAPAAAPSGDRSARAKQIAASLLAPAAKAPPAPAAPMAAPAAPAAPGEYDPPSEFQQALLWFQEFAEYRAQRIDAWERAVGGTGNRFCIPAMVDFGFSLRDLDETPVTQEKQVVVMGQLSRRQKRGRLVHGYVAFNPIRYALPRLQALDVVKKAIEEHGFLGVKLYPPMGFRVSGNVGALPNLDNLLRYLGPRYTNDPVGFTRRIDEGLRLLFEYCAANDVPIMAHTGPTNLAYYTYDDRPNPTYWRAVLAKHQKLRVNFGHFGGAWRKEKDDSHGRGDYAWAREIIKLFADYPNVYGDFADYEAVLAANEKDKEDMADLEKFLKSLDPAQTALMRRRLMFGTDWEMMGRVPNNHLFAEKILKFMVNTLGGSTDDYASGNALRFAGLDDDSSGVTRRLTAFHQANSVNGPTLQEFRKLVR